MPRSGFQMHQVQVGRHRQVAGELVIRLDFDRADGNVRAAAQQVEQPHAELPGKTFVDDFQRVQTLAHHAALGVRIVRLDLALFADYRFGFITRAVAVEQGVDLCL